MNLILRYLEGRKAVPASSDPALKAQLKQVKKDLQQILNKWKFGEEPIRTSEEFLAQFEPWVKSQIEKQKELKVFLSKKGVLDLKEADSKLTNRDLSENEELEQIRKELAEKEQEWGHTEEHYLKRIKELEESRGEDYEDLITEKDQLARDKNELEQETLSLNNKLKLKQQEVQTKEKTIETLKKEKDKGAVNYQKTLKELKDKYSKQGKLLDEEQLEGKRLEEENERLQKEVGRLIQALNDEINNKGGGILE